VLAGIYIWFAFRAFQAYRFSARHDQISLRRAIQLQPRDANNYDFLGQYFLWQAQDPRAAATQFQQAARLNPYSSSYWLHLAQAENSLGNEVQQANAIRKAVAVDPTTPELAWTAANFFLVQGQTEEALDQFAVVIRNDPSIAAAALERSWRASGQVDSIEQRLPRDPEVYLSFVKLLVAKEQWAAAKHMWESMLSLNRQFDARSALFYVDALLTKQEVAAAQSAWQRIVNASSNLKPYITPDNLIVNPSFSHEFLNAAFDWHDSAQNGVAMVLDPTQTYQASEALLITYAGPDNGDAGIWQYIPVVSGVAYVASAWVKSEELESANGPELSISDAYHNQLLARSEETLGSTSWHQVHITFTAPKETTLVVVRFSREPASTRIRGKFWVDNVRMSQDVRQSLNSVH